MSIWEGTALLTNTILIVEDEPSIAENISYALSTEGFASIRCATGQDAQEVLQRRDIVLVILDIGLPDMNGFELAKTIRRGNDVPLIFVTARADEIDRVVGLEIGADDYVVKPFSPRELTARVKAVLRRTRTPGSGATRTDRSEQRFEVDTARHRIVYWGTPLQLTRYEYRLLRALVERPGRVYTRQELMDGVWEEPEQSLDRTVDTHIKLLRQKLKVVRPQDDPIVTHRGIGYALKEAL